MLKPDKDAAIPEMTKIIAKAAFPQGNIFLTMRDEMARYSKMKYFATCTLRLVSQLKVQPVWHWSP